MNIVARMKIVMDEKIPYLQGALTQMGHTVTAMPGDAIDAVALEGAGALFVRTRTLCNAALLDGTDVRFIGTATIGYDHIDADYCRRAGIEWVSAPGCNADAVLQYVQSSIYSWLQDKKTDISALAIGIVGVGRIGSRVERWARSQGMTVLLNDPPRQAAGEQGLVSLDEIARVCDIVTFHPTLSLSGPFRSYHLLDSAFLAKINRRALLINASRGAVADNNALYDAVVGNSLLDVALDVWENEPKISQELLDRAFIATPHIAGYSAKGKLNASLMMLQAFAQYTSYKAELPHIELPPPANNNIEASTLADALLKIYSPLSDTAKLKSSPSMFEWLRNNYELRREPSEFIVRVDGKPVVL